MANKPHKIRPSISGVGVRGRVGVDLTSHHIKFTKPGSDASKSSFPERFRGHQGPFSFLLLSKAWIFL